MKADDLLIVVPARGGSKGLPGKNARTLLDIPLLGWTAEAIRQSGIQGATAIVSTDDERIANIGKLSGLEVPFIRPAELAEDESSAESVVLHALDQFQLKHGYNATYVMLLQPTSPFRPPSVIIDAYTAIKTSEYDAVIGVRAIYRSQETLYTLNKNAELKPFKRSEKIATRRQDVVSTYTPNGAMYIIRSDVLRKRQTFFPEKILGLEMGKVESHDIDDPVDWLVAESLASSGMTWREKIIN